MWEILQYKPRYSPIPFRRENLFPPAGGGMAAVFEVNEELEPSGTVGICERGPVENTNIGHLQQLQYCALLN